MCMLTLIAILAAYEAIVTSIQPQRSLLITKLYSMAPITLSSMCMILLIAILVTSKQPQRLLLTSNMNSMASITYITVLLASKWLYF